MAHNKASQKTLILQGLRLRNATGSQEGLPTKTPEAYVHFHNERRRPTLSDILSHLVSEQSNRLATVRRDRTTMASSDVSDQVDVAVVENIHASKLEKVPPEILVLIFNHLDRVDRLNVALVCKQISRAVTRCLYRNINIRIINEQNLEIDTPAYIQKWRMLSRTLLEQPQLAEMIRGIRVASWHPCSVQEDPNPAKLLPKAMRTIQALGLDQYLDDLPKSSLAFSTALLQATRLQALTLVFGSLQPLQPGSTTAGELRSERDTLLWRVLAAGDSISRPCGQHFFANLSDVTLSNGAGFSHHDDHVSRLQFSAIDLVLQLPSLRMLVLIGLKDVNRADEDNSWQCEARSSTVKDIIFGSCEISTTSISRILRSCKAIENLTWGRQCPENECRLLLRHGVQPADWQILYEALLLHQDSLESFDCGEHLQSYCVCDHQTPYADVPFVTMHHLHQLKDLYISMSAIYPNGRPITWSLLEIIPQDLHSLEIRADDNTRLDLLVCALANLCRRRTLLIASVVRVAQVQIDQLGRLGVLKGKELEGVSLMGGGLLAPGTSLSLNALVVHTGKRRQEHHRVELVRGTEWELIPDEKEGCYKVEKFDPALRVEEDDESE